MQKEKRHLLGRAIVLAGAALNAQFLVEWMRHSNI